MSMLSGFMNSAPQKSIQEIEVEFNALSCEEKAQIHKDIYGFGNYDVIENDDLISSRLLEFEEEISKISTEKQECYLRGLQINPIYVTSSDLRLRFLRREFFDAKKAAIRYINYWKDKVDVWGEEKAFRKIKISDFEEDDQSVLKQGSHQILKERDCFGRVILVIDKSRNDNRPTFRMSVVRMVWYQVECATENAEDQKNGVVAVIGVLLAPPALKYENRKLQNMILRMVNESLPHRVVAIHSLTTSRIEQFVVPFFLYMLGSDMRYRFKLHSNPRTIFSELETFGISRSVLPKDIGGTSIYSHEDWLEERRSQYI